MLKKRTGNLHERINHGQHLISRATPDLSLLIKFSVDLIVRMFQSTDLISKAIFEFSFSCYKASSHTVKNYNENFQ